ncbi:minichromosome maintenance protein MCM [Desulfurococcaceae archaeon AG1]|nr:minichromosome maintenance protein MCM [Desulfurococcaceae archaeon AG1]
MEASVDLTETREDLLGRVLEFIESVRDKDGSIKYRARVREAIASGSRSVVIDYIDIINFDNELARNVIENPEELIKVFSEALTNIARTEYILFQGSLNPRFRGIPQSIAIRELRNEHIGKLVQVSGIVVKMTPPKQKMIKAMWQHISPECGDKFDLDVKSDIIEKPSHCRRCGLSSGIFKLLENESLYTDHQRISIGEMPEEVPSGQMPRQVQVILEGDLVDRVRPGDKVQVVGIVRLSGIGSSSRRSKAVYEIEIYGNNIETRDKGVEEIELSEEDIDEIRKLAKDPMITRKIIASIAPAIYGHWDVKEAIALLLFGGVPKHRSDGTKIRGDVHVLIIGDPGTAKSQLLQFASKIAPRGIYTTGKGSTAAGLTAAVVRDKNTGEYYLEAGAMVLGDMGVVCIDEIDKMREDDRTAIHEALEQQTVSISKAGIHATLNARASVLAAGNPRYGRYIDDRPLIDNINLPVTILSRFDLIFVLKDQPSLEEDRQLAEHITSAHTSFEDVKAPIDPGLLRKYIIYARRNVKPKLSEEARKMIADFFVEMRRAAAENKEAPIAITARQLEALIRLTEAHARMRLSSIATEEDAAEAIRLMRTMLESVGIDIESGSLDIDTIMTGKPKSRREKMLLIEDIIKDLSSKSQTACANVKEILSRAKEHGIEEEIAEKMLSQLLKEGIIYEKAPGCYRKV